MLVFFHDRVAEMARAKIALKFWDKMKLDLKKVPNSLLADIFKSVRIKSIALLPNEDDRQGETKKLEKNFPKPLIRHQPKKYETSPEKVRKPNIWNANNH